MPLGAPVVPEENMMTRGALKGSWTDRSADVPLDLM